MGQTTEQAAGIGLSFIAAQGDLTAQAQAGTLQLAAWDTVRLQSASRHVDWSAAQRIVLAVAGERQNYTISEPDEPGDGTVPHRSGIAPQDHVRSLLQVNTGHEPAYYAGADVEKVRQFTVRAIVKIAQRIRETSLAYR